MDFGELREYLRPLRRRLGDPYRKWAIDRHLPAMANDAVVPLDQTSDVVLLCRRCRPPYIVPETYVSELAFGHELAARGRTFAVAEDARDVFEKTVVWFIPGNGRDFVAPRLWDYTAQVRAFAAGLERQGNRPFCSSGEMAFWENKSHMHKRLDGVGAPTPNTVVLTAENWQSEPFDLAPVLIKEEHSAGSQGVHHFATADAARNFVERYPFRRGETLIMQEVVRGATMDMRLTMVGDRMIEEASYWRKKNPAALASPKWTTTATSYDSIVEHANVPASVVPMAAEVLRRLGIRTAGIDLIWVDDDVDGEPLFLELSPKYQPNPPKPARYADWSYKQYKNKRRNVKEGYLLHQYWVFRRIAAEVLNQELL
jgi:hypothetical protein